MITFIAGLSIGSVVGFISAALCAAASLADEDWEVLLMNINIDTLNGIKQYKSLESMIRDNIVEEKSKETVKQIIKIISYQLVKQGYSSYHEMDIWESEEE